MLNSCIILLLSCSICSDTPIPQLEELRQVERRVMDKEKELSRKNKRLSQIEVSKEELQDKLNEQKISERINLSMSMIDLNSSFSPVRK